MKIKILLSVVAASVLLFAACKSGDQTEEVLTQVNVIELKDTSCVLDVIFPATIKGLQDVAIYPQVNGRITAIKVIEGQYVNKGDVLFEIDDVPYRAAYDAAAAEMEIAKAKLKSAKLTLESKQNLFDKGIISEYQLNIAKNDVATADAYVGQAAAAMKNAANNLSFTKVRTMGKGNIGSLPYKVGSLVGSSMTTPLTIVSDNSSIYADFSITENNYLEMDIAADNLKSMEFSLITNLGEKYSRMGKLHSISGLISNETGSIPVRTIFPNPEKKLLSGGACKVQYSYKRDNSIIVPRSAMKEIQDKLFVFVVKDGTLHQTAVSAYRVNSSQYLILPNEDGSYPVKVGDLITSTTTRLFDGIKVSIAK